MQQRKEQKEKKNKKKKTGSSFQNKGKQNLIIEELTLFAARCATINTFVSSIAIELVFRITIANTYSSRYQYCVKTKRKKRKKKKRRRKQDPRSKTKVNKL